MVRGWVPRVGPFTAASLAARIGLAPIRVESALARLEAEGLVLRGRFLPGAPWSHEAPHWCERSVLARIHRLTIGRLRREIEPASAADLLRFLARWQHVAPGTRLHGARGLAEVVGQLQGFHAAAGAWERELLASRLAGYERGLLDELCLGGEVAWGRLAVVATEGEAPRRRNAPTRNAPVSLALREDLPWLLAAAAGSPPPLGPSAQGLVDVLARRGASFLPDLAAATGRLPGEVEQALWELVSAGYLTCDGFAGLRALVEPAPRGRPARRPGFAGGRWSLLRLPCERVDRAAPERAGGPVGAGPRLERFRTTPSRGSRRSTSGAGAWCSATSSRARRRRRPGGSSSASTAPWRRAARSGAAGSWRGSPASSSRCRRRWRRCARSVARRARGPSAWRSAAPTR